MSTRNPFNSASRRAYAELIREFLAGGCITDQYEDRFFELMDRHGRDRACEDIFDALWHFYGDIFPHRMRGKHRLPPEARKLIARWVLFLRSDEPYVPPPRSPERRASRAMFLTAIALVLFAYLAIGLSLSWDLANAFAAVCFVFAYASSWLLGGVSINAAVFDAASKQLACWPFQSEESLCRVRCATQARLLAHS